MHWVMTDHEVISKSRSQLDVMCALFRFNFRGDLDGYKLLNEFRHYEVCLF